MLTALTLRALPSCRPASGVPNRALPLSLQRGVSPEELLLGRRGVASAGGWRRGKPRALRGSGFGPDLPTPGSNRFCRAEIHRRRLPLPEHLREQRVHCPPRCLSHCPPPAPGVPVPLPAPPASGLGLCIAHIPVQIWGPLATLLTGGRGRTTPGAPRFRRHLRPHSPGAAATGASGCLLARLRPPSHG